MGAPSPRGPAGPPPVMSFNKHSEGFFSMGTVSWLPLVTGDEMRGVGVRGQLWRGGAQAALRGWTKLPPSSCSLPSWVQLHHPEAIQNRGTEIQGSG